jgi:hypothetical protein
MPIVRVCVASYAYEARTDEEISINERDLLLILDLDDPEWWKARKESFTDGQLMVQEGLVPANYLDNVSLEQSTQLCLTSTMRPHRHQFCITLNHYILMTLKVMKSSALLKT